MKFNVWIYRHIKRKDWFLFCRTKVWMVESIFNTVELSGSFWINCVTFLQSKVPARVEVLSVLQDRKCFVRHNLHRFHSPARWAPGSTPVPLHCSGRGLTACPVWTGPAAAHGAPPSWWSSPLRWNRCSLGPAGKNEKSNTQTNGP